MRSCAQSRYCRSLIGGTIFYLRALLEGLFEGPSADPQIRAELEAEAAKSAAVLVLEPSLPGGALKTSRKGVGQFELIARGISAHAGLDPGKGVSAIRELARQIVAVDALQDAASGVTLTVGIVSGGTRANVVPAEARATFDARAITRADGAPALAAQQRAMEPNDWHRVSTVGSATIAPDGKRVAFTVTTIAERENRRHSEIWVVPTAGGTPR